jgi:hypothetical protein
MGTVPLHCVAVCRSLPRCRQPVTAHQAECIGRCAAVREYPTRLRRVGYSYPSQCVSRNSSTARIPMAYPRRIHVRYVSDKRYPAPLKYPRIIDYKPANARYASSLLDHTERLFAFADKHRGSYTRTFPELSAYYKSTAPRRTRTSSCGRPAGCTTPPATRAT